MHLGQGKGRKTKMVWTCEAEGAEGTSSKGRETLIVEGKRSRGRPRLTWDEHTRYDLLKVHLSEDMISDRSS